MKKKFITVAAVSLLSVGATDRVFADVVEDPTVKCYGVAKANKNHCANASGTHGCAAQAVTDNDPCEWQALTRSECSKGIQEAGTTIVGTEKPENCKAIVDQEGEDDIAGEKESAEDADTIKTDTSSTKTSSTGVDSTITSKVPMTDAVPAMTTETGADAPSDDNASDN